ncbi:hypothetical protein WHR41_06005 [Cladosporium halotolerans]|uniref:Uncharacterized protein n=1 Tax=Cladosporium halotolerans TaxID=1052096 RepID=A0AB34KKH9_9PEZI
MHQIDLLVLGAGWTSTFLLPLLEERNWSFAATTTDGRKVEGFDTIKWRFEPDSKDGSQMSSLPLAKHVLITFPLTSAEQADYLIKSYEDGHGKAPHPTRFIQLGSTGIWQIPQKTIWVSRRSPYNTSMPRAVAEDAVLKHGGCVLNLAGLWGGQRDPSTWVDRVAKTKEDVKGKKSLHLVHGLDVSRAIVAVIGNWEAAKGQRWMLTDGFVYDWWALFVGWAEPKKQGDAGAAGDKVDDMPSHQARWVFELMGEEKIWALPRSMEVLGRCYFGREFWDTFKLAPLKARV